MVIHSENWPLPQHTTPRRRRWTPVDELTLALDFDEAHDAPAGPRYPRGWFAWQLARILHDARVIRATQETTR